LYLTAFMDDHARFIVSHALGHHQRSMLVMEALARGIADYGTPEEILTDQGRQYTAWRGETDFEQELRRQGIRHIKSRPQHPQTLGKVERFWKTLWEEFLSRTVFADFADCARRLGLFIDGYNFQRPHQGIEGMVPADRYFRAATHVRAAIEKNVQDNALRLSLEQKARKPFYLVGRLGDRDLTIAAQGSGLRVQLGDAAPETIELPRSEQSKERDDHEHQVIEEQVHARPPQAPIAPDAEVDRGPPGPRRDGTAPVPDGVERLERRARGDGGDRRGEDLARDVLHVGGAGALRDDRGACSHDERGGGEHGREPREADRGARSEGDQTRTREAARRTPALAHAES
jgi:hypothetical protein